MEVEGIVENGETIKEGNRSLYCRFRRHMDP
jgi:hypothetical protein